MNKHLQLYNQLDDYRGGLNNCYYSNKLQIHDSVLDIQYDKNFLNKYHKKQNIIGISITTKTFNVNVPFRTKKNNNNNNN